MARTLLKVPASARRGELVEIRALIAHPMETGYRLDATGKPLPRDILRRFTCRYNGELVIGIELHPAVAANPYFAFSTIASESGTLTFAWEGDNGFAQTETAPIAVT